MLPAVLYAERRPDRTLEALENALRRYESLQYQTADSDWEVLVNSPEDGFAAATTDGTAVLSAVCPVDANTYGSILLWPGKASAQIELRIRNEEGDDPLEGVFVRHGEFHQRAWTTREWFTDKGVHTEFLKNFRGLLFLRTEDGSPFAPLGLRFGKRTGPLSAVPMFRGGNVSGGLPSD